MIDTQTELEPSRDSHILVRERFYPTSSGVMELVRLIRESKCTGTLLIDFNQGGIGSLRFREEINVTSPR